MAPKLVATVMGRAFVGSPLNRDPELLTTALQFVSDVFAGGWKLKWYNISLRPFAARFLIPEIWRVWKAMGVARRMFRPAIEARMRACERDDEDDKEKPNHTLMQWIVEHGTKASPPRSVGNMAELTLLAYLGSTHTTATTLSSLLLDLAAHPDCVEGLRKEAKESQGGHDEVWSSKDKLHIRRTSKLDSCMKESQRLSPAFLSELPPSHPHLEWHTTDNTTLMQCHSPASSPSHSNSRMASSFPKARTSSVPQPQYPLTTKPITPQKHFVAFASISFGWPPRAMRLNTNSRRQPRVASISDMGERRALEGFWPVL